MKEQEGWITANLRDIIDEESESENEDEKGEIKMQEVDNKDEAINTS